MNSVQLRQTIPAKLRHSGGTMRRQGTALSPALMLPMTPTMMGISAVKAPAIGAPARWQASASNQ